MPAKLCLFAYDLLMVVETKLHPVLVFDVYQDPDSDQTAYVKGSPKIQPIGPAYRIRIRAKEPMATTVSISS